YRHKLNRNVDLAGGDVWDTGIRILADVIDFVLVVEEAHGKDSRHGDIHAHQLSLLVLDVPWRVCAASANDQLAPVQHCPQQAVVCCLGVGDLRRQYEACACRACCQSTAKTESSGLEDVTSLQETVAHDFVPPCIDRNVPRSRK